MTITPLAPAPAAPAPGSTPTSAGRPGSAAAALFGLLVDQHLGTAEGAAPDPAAASATAASAATAPATTPATVPAAGPAGTPLAVPAAVTGAAGDTVEEDADDTAADADGSTPTAPDATASGGLAALAGFPVVALPVLSQTATPTQGGHDEPAGSRSEASGTVDASEPTGATVTSAVGTDPATAVVTGQSSAATPDQAITQTTGAPVVDPSATAPAPSASSAAGVSAAGLTPVVATTTTGGTTATPAPADAATRSAVLDQVLPALPRVVLRGDGTSRLTLKLHPADLGEVHVTVTVRGQEVDVTLAAGARAREALSEGSSRLRGLLEGIGHTTGQVVLRDLPGGSAPVQPAVGQQPAGTGPHAGGQSSGQAGGQGQADDRGQGFGRPAGLDGGPAGREGDSSTHLRPSGTVRHQPSAAAGIDVTI
ncbi:flagellar hook-length control protein FliK [Nocardioides panacis]|uniref:Flagellar hook-length control protein FliK n=1 Tax=Nocardioides panacis TaxID=2849501 RepID=A0A975SYW4_9ACTN|nr:flagellar hook-length control protein FliK [Nocardioides panacis]QWZ08492.1 flagellar hook-length control protein FliK [Nocardioides panacis]